jgi:hypothetical protein
LNFMISVVALSVTAVFRVFYASVIIFVSFVVIPVYIKVVLS